MEFCTMFLDISGRCYTLCVLWWIIALDDMTLPHMMYSMLINEFPRALPLFWCKLCADMSIRTEVIEIKPSKFH